MMMVIMTPVMNLMITVILMVTINCSSPIPDPFGLFLRWIDFLLQVVNQVWLPIYLSTVVFKSIYLADFLKTNLTKFAVIWVKRGQRQVFKLEKLQNHSDEGKGEEKKKERGEGKEEKRKKINGCTPSFYNSYFWDSFWPKKTVERKTSIWQ